MPESNTTAAMLTVCIVDSLAAPPPKVGPAPRLVLLDDHCRCTEEPQTPAALAEAARYALRHNAYVVPGRFFADGALCLCMLSPKGKVVGVQQAVYLHLSLRARAPKRGRAPAPFETPFGAVALLPDVDVNYPQVAREAVQAGARLLIAGGYVDPYDISDEMIYLGPQNAARSNGVAVVYAVAEQKGVFLGTGQPACDPCGPEQPLVCSLRLPLLQNGICCEPAAMYHAARLLHTHGGAMVSPDDPDEGGATL